MNKQTGKYVVEKVVSLSQDGNSNFVKDTYVFDTEDEAKQFAKKAINGWVHCYINGECVRLD